MRTGEFFDKKVKFEPTLFLKSTKKSEIKDIYGNSVHPVRFQSIMECRGWIKEKSQIANIEILGMQDFTSQYIAEEYPGEIKFDRSLINVAHIDIEVKSDEGFPEPEDAKHPVTSIVLYDDFSKKYRVWGLGDYDVARSELEGISLDKIEYVKCKTEIELLSKFCATWGIIKPDVITGWYIRLFDIPYLVNRLTLLFGSEKAKDLSPWGMVKEREIRALNKVKQAYDLEGIQQLDYLDLFQKFGYTFGTQENNKLDTIAHVVLGEKKLSYEEYTSLANLYVNDHQKFIDYNIKDVYLVVKMDEVLDFISLAATIAFWAGSNFTESLGSVAVWDKILYRELYPQNIVIPQKTQKFKTQYPGGHVKEPIPGKYEWVCSFDLNSLYPNLIIQYNMSPETLIDGDVDTVDVETALNEKYIAGPNYAVAANGIKFSKKSTGFIPKIVKELYDQRVAVKGEVKKLKQQQQVADTQELRGEISRLDNKQQAIKILLNSLYGAMANEHFRYFDVRLASAITLSGQLSIRWAEKCVNKYLNKVMKTTDEDYVVASDTDSLYITLNPIVENVFVNPTVKEKIVDFIDYLCENDLTKVIEDGYAALFRRMNAYDNRMVMKREAISDKGIWTAKKRYILNVLDNEGVRYSTPKLKVMGIEAVKSSTPEVCRNKLKEAFKIAVHGTEEQMQKFIEDFRNEFKTLDPDKVAFPRGVSEIDKWDNPSAKGIPIHVRGSISYNRYKKDKGLDDKYETIKAGDKIKFTYLHTPNPTYGNCISFPVFLPEEFGLHQYVDYDTQFDKAFLKPLLPVLDAIKWKQEKVATLLDLF